MKIERRKERLRKRKAERETKKERRIGREGERRQRIKKNGEIYMTYKGRNIFRKKKT